MLLNYTEATKMRPQSSFTSFCHSKLSKVSNMSIVTYEKPLPHLSLADWYAKQWENQQTSATRGKDSFDLRHESRQLRNETKVRTEWDTYLNNARLSDRIIELERWRDLLQSVLERINQELANLKREKFETDKEIDGLGTRLSVISECISMRDCRLGEELSYDDGERELKKELCLVENVKKNLTERSQAAWEKINRLEEIKFQLNLDLNDKTEAVDIDGHQLALDKQSASITYKMNATRTPKNSITYEKWLEHTQYVKQQSDNELADTLKLCESMFVVRERSKNDMVSQRDFVDFNLRKRISEIQKARNETEWQQKKLREEIGKLTAEVGTLRDSIVDKDKALQLAETRLENRSYRPGYELTLDEPFHGLKNEVLQLQQTIQDLKNKMNCAKATVSALEEQLVIIDRDLENKNQAMMTDIRCLDLRVRLKTEQPASITDRNIKLARMEDEIPPT